MKLTESFKEMKHRKFWTVAGMQLLLLITTLLILLCWRWYVNAEAASTPEFDFNQPLQLLEQDSADLDAFKVTLVMSGFIASIFLVLNYALWKNIIWSRIAGKQFSHYFRFLLVMIVWFIILIPSLYLYFTYNISMSASVLATYNNTYIMLFGLVDIAIILPLLMYIVNIGELLQYNFFREEHFIKKTLNTIKNIKLMYPASFIMGFVLAVIMYITTSLDMATYAGMIAFTLLLALYAAWSKIYLVKTVD